MWKTITFLTVISSSAVFFTACSHKEPSVEERLHAQYGWNGTLPKPAADADAGKEAQEQNPSPVIVSREQQPAAQTPEPEKKDDVKPDDVKTEKKETVSADKKLTKADLSGEKREHVVQKGESLWLLALKEYGDGIYWRWIYEENTDVIKGDPNRIIPGTKIKIPMLKKDPSGEKAPSEKKADAEKPAEQSADKTVSEKTPDKTPAK